MRKLKPEACLHAELDLNPGDTAASHADHKEQFLSELLCAGPYKQSYTILPTA